MAAMLSRSQCVKINLTGAGCRIYTQIAKFMGPIWDPPSSCRPQMGTMLVPWTLPPGYASTHWAIICSDSALSTVRSHCPMQCWFILNRTPQNKLKLELNQYAKFSSTRTHYKMPCTNGSHLISLSICYFINKRTSHERHGVSNHRQLHWLSKCLFRLTA